MLFSLTSTWINPVTDQMSRKLQAVNLVAADTSNATCDFLRTSVEAWVIAVSTRGGMYDSYLLTLDLRPVRCGYNFSQFINVAWCRRAQSDFVPSICEEWKDIAYDETETEIAEESGIREGSIEMLNQTMMANLTRVRDDGSVVVERAEFSVVTRFNHTLSIQAA